MEKKFGLLIGSLIILLMFFKGAELSRLLLLILTFLLVILLTISFFFPFVLKPIVKQWLNLSTLLAKITNPLIMFAIFFIIFMPLGILFRFIKKDILDITISKKKNTYWYDRNDIFNPDSMRNQF